MFKKILPIAILSISAFSLNSCIKKSFDTKHQSATQDMALGENIFSDAYKQVGASGQATQDSLGKSANEMMAGCGTLTITPYDTVSWPKTVTLDFGPTNCYGSDFNARRGKIIGTFSYWMRQTGSVVTVNFDQYFVNDHKVEGTETITNAGRNTAGNLLFDISFPNCVITKPNNGGTINWTTTRQHEWSEGEFTWTPADDVWLVRGTADCTASNGEVVNFTVTQDLNVKWGCRWIRSGYLNINMEGLTPIGVDYGSGGCDANATAYYNGVEYPFIMQ